ncbi:MAG TPA: MlaD family protein [Baekduia sp.]|uniref:MlaD family protein n=1 Tax=Baekduia sp. TaxID=2600305 RepID=UPI002D76FE29|nr:MlaD family protein [Baekduia sp.]HET6508347.1 MlaD family protein [Baekduia sp.]
MNKQVPSLGKIFVMVGFALSCFGLLLFLWLAFGGSTPFAPKGYQFKVSFGEATQLAQEADVRISGVPVGKVKAIQTNKQTGRSDATIQLDPDYAPLPSDARATLRQKTLLGETYVELTPGTPKARPIPDNGRLATGRVADTVELDEILRTFDPRTRKAFQTWIQTQAESLNGRGQDLNDALGQLAPFAEDTTKLLQILNEQKAGVRQLVRNTGVVFDALSERDKQLAGVITNSNRVFATTAARDAELQATFKALPTFEEESATTLKRLSRFSANANPVVTQLRPAARELSPTLEQLSAIAPDLKHLFRSIDPLTKASKKGLPATEQFLDDLHPLLANFDAPLQQLNPILDGAGLYKSELNAFFANATASTQAVTPSQASGENLHYLRTANPLNPEALAQYPNRLKTNRTNPYAFPGDSNSLKTGLSSFETRQCGSATAPNPTLGPAVPGVMDETLRDNILKYALNNGNVVAPPCTQQPRFNLGGTLTQFPQVKANVAGLQAGLPQP